MILGNCLSCKIQFRKREKKYKFCSLKCSNKFNQNGVKEIRVPGYCEELAEFIGICLGDGGLTHFQCKVYLNSEIDKDYAEYVKKLMLNLFNTSASIMKHKIHKVLRVTVSSVNLIKYLTTIGLHTGNKVHLQVDVPNWILSKPEYIKACVRGLIDTDGSFVIHRYKIKGTTYRYPKINFTNKSVPLLDFVYMELKKLGFNPKKSYKDQVWLHSQKKVYKYLEMIGTNNYKPNILKIMEGNLEVKAK